MKYRRYSSLGFILVLALLLSFAQAEEYKHKKQITGLSPSTTYHYRITSKDAQGNPTVSQDYTFTTPAAGSTGGGGSTYHAPAPTSSLVVNVLTKGATANDSTNDTAAIQSAVNQVAGTGGTVLVPTGTYMIDALTHVNLGSNMTFKMETGAVLKAIATSASTYDIIRIEGKTNVNVVGGKLHGERNEHIPTTWNRVPRDQGDQWGMGLTVAGSSNVYVDGVTAIECWGDGFYQAGWPSPSSNINFYNVVADDNRRQGLSAESVNGLVIRDSVFKNTQGQWPMAGIDLEPFNAAFVVTNVQIINNQFINNYSAGVKLFAHVGPTITNVTVTNNTTSGGRWGMYYKGNKGGITTSNNIITNPILDGILVVGDLSDNNVYSNNTITSSPALTGDHAGIRFQTGASGNIGSGNSITGFPYGIKDEVGGNNVL